MKRSMLYALAAATVVLAGCGGGSGGYDSGGGGGDGGGTGMQPPPTVGPSGFVPFVRAQFEATSNASEAVEINDREFSFDEDESAYADLL